MTSDMKTPLLDKPWYRSILHSLNCDVLLAGLAGGALATLCLHPLDVIKIQLQVSENHSLRQRHVYVNMREVVPAVYRQAGISGFYQGLSPNLAGAACSWGLYFFIYHGLKTARLQNSSNTHLVLSEHLTFATLAGLVTLTLTNPIWVVKTRMVLQATRETGCQYRGLLHGLATLARREGVRGLYRGYVPGILGVSHGVVQFVSYEKMKEWYYDHHGYDTGVKLSVPPYIALSAASKILAVTTTYPYQVLRSRLQDTSCQYTGTWDLITRTARHEGWRGFYKGIVPNIVRVTPACCITFLCYENVIHYLNSYRSDDKG